MEKNFTKSLKKQLRNCIKGGISVHVDNDILIIDIFDNEYKAWRYTISNLSYELSIGATSKIVADAIVKEYRKDIMKHYFH